MKKCFSESIWNFIQKWSNGSLCVLDLNSLFLVATTGQTAVEARICNISTYFYKELFLSHLLVLEIIYLAINP